MLFSELIDEEIFNGGPPRKLQKALHLLRSRFELNIARRARIVVLVTWLPLAVLVVATEGVTGTPALPTFLTDIGSYARYLIAAPLLILAEGDTIPIFGRVVRHFLLGGFVASGDRPRYDAAITSTRSLLDSKIAEVTAVLLAYAVTIIFTREVRHADTPSWVWNSASNLPLGLSPAGMWHEFVSLPILLLLCFGWFWKIGLWWRFLWLMSQLDLCLVSTHPDQAGGLKFVSTSVRGYRILALAFSTIVAGAQMNFMIRTGLGPSAIRKAAIEIALFVLALATGPLFLFVSRLRATRIKGVFKYGALGRDVGSKFEGKWLDRLGTFDVSTLDTNDFSAMTDLNQVVGNAHNVKDIPFGWRDVSYLAVIAIIPFIPAALMAVPLSDILKELAKLLV